MKIRWNLRTPIGLDVGARTINAVQLHGGPGSWRVEAATGIKRRAGAESAPSTEELQQLSAVLYRQGFTGMRVVLVAPESALFSTTLELPPRSSGAPIEELARQELARAAKRDVGSIEVSTWDVPAPPRSAEATHLVAVGLAHEDADALLSAFEGAGFEVEALDCRCCAMARACAGASGNGPHVSAIVDVTDSAASIAVVHTGIVAYNRPIPEAGLGRVRDRMCSELRVDAEAADYLLDAVARGTDGDVDAPAPEHTASAARLLDDFVGTLVQELRSVMAYAIHRYPGTIGPVLLTGAGAGLRPLHARIRTELDLDVKVVTLGDVAQCAPELAPQAQDPSLTTAAGMAMHAPLRAARRAA